MNVSYNPLKCCPFCGSNQTESDLTMLSDVTVDWQMKCNDCDGEWIDVFTYTHSTTIHGEKLFIVKKEEE